MSHEQIQLGEVLATLGVVPQLPQDERGQPSSLPSIRTANLQQASRTYVRLAPQGFEDLPVPTETSILS